MSRGTWASTVVVVLLVAGCATSDPEQSESAWAWMRKEGPGAGSSESPSKLSDGTSAAVASESEATERIAAPEKAPPPPATDPKTPPVVPQRAALYVVVVEPATGGVATEMPLKIPDPSVASPLAEEVVVGGTRFLARSYAPSISIQERLVPAPQGEAGFPALRFTFGDGKQKHDRWFVPGSRLLGQAQLVSASVRCVPRLSPAQIADEETELRQLLSPGPKLVVELKRDGRRVVLPVEEGKNAQLKSPDYRFEFRKLFNSFAIDSKTGQAVDRSTRPINPALELRVEHAGESRTAWLFSQLPGFSKGGEDENARLRLAYPLPDHPHPRAEIVVVDAGADAATILFAAGGALETGEVPLNASKLFSGMQITFHERLASAKVSQTARVHPSGGPAVLLAWGDEDSFGERWLPLGVPEELFLGDSAFVAGLRRPRAGPHGALTPGVDAGSAVLPPGHPRLTPPSGAGSISPSPPGPPSGDASMPSAAETNPR